MGVPLPRWDRVPAAFYFARLLLRCWSFEAVAGDWRGRITLGSRVICVMGCASLPGLIGERPVQETYAFTVSPPNDKRSASRLNRRGDEHRLKQGFWKEFAPPPIVRDYRYDARALIRIPVPGSISRGRHGPWRYFGSGERWARKVRIR